MGDEMNNMFGNLFGSLAPQPDPTLQQYYDPKAAMWNAIGGGLQGAGAGLASGKPGAWAQGLVIGSGQGLDNYKENTGRRAAAAKMLEEADAKKQERARAEEERKRRQDFIKTLPPDQQMKAMSVPGYLEKLIEATDPAFQTASEGFTLGAGQIRYDASGNKVAEGPPKEPDANNNPFQNEYKLRGEFTTEAKPFTDLRTNFQRIQAASKDETGASDIAMIFSFMKMLDPGSTVREGEFATAANAGGLPAQVISVYNNAINGQKLAPQLRQQFVQQAARQYQEQSNTYGQIRKKYIDMATQYGLNPDLVAPDLSYGVIPEISGAEPESDGWTVLPDGTRIRERGQ